MSIDDNKPFTASMARELTGKVKERYVASLIKAIKEQVEKGEYTLYQVVEGVNDNAHCIEYVIDYFKLLGYNITFRPSEVEHYYTKEWIFDDFMKMPRTRYKQASITISWEEENNE